MAQHDYVIANGTGAAVRSDLNNALLAIVSQNSGATEPTTTYAYQWWADTTTGLLKIRNSANNGWITLRELDGTLTIEDGTVSAPGLAFRDDLNTGIWRPGTDQFAISTNGVERVEFGASEVVFNDGGADYDFRVEGDTNANLLFVDASTDRVGIGTSSPDRQLTIAGAAVSGTQVHINSTVSSAGIKFSPSSGDAYEIQAGTDSKFVLYNRTDEAYRLVVDGSGNVGIGTTNPQTALHLTTSGAGQFRHSDGTRSIAVGSTGSETFVGSGANLTFLTNGLTSSDEKARIDTSGRLLVGTSSAFRTDAFVQIKGGNGSSVASLALASTTTNPGVGTDLASITISDTGGNRGAQIVATADGNWTSGSSNPTYLSIQTTASGASSPTERMRIDNLGRIFTYNANTGNNSLTVASAAAAGTAVANFIGAYGATGINTGTSSFIVWTNGNVQNTNNSYTAISDVKLKENIVDANSQWDDIKALQVRNYNLKEGQTHRQIGLIAQEVEPVSPGLVYESPDRDEDGNDLGTVTKSVNYSVLYMKAVKALQEAMERIETLEAKVAALETP